MGSLKDFLQQYKGRKTVPNYTAVVTHGLAKGVGSKPGSKTRRKGPASRKKPEVEVCVDPDLSQFECSSSSATLSSPPEKQQPNEASPAPSSLASNVQVFQHKNSNTSTGISSPVTVQYLASPSSVINQPL